jgi:hypothetical protein
VAGRTVEQELQTLKRLTIQLHELEARIEKTVGRARDGGATWEQLGRALRVKRQTAWQRYAKVLPQAEAADQAPAPAADGAAAIRSTRPKSGHTGPPPDRLDRQASRPPRGKRP